MSDPVYLAGVLPGSMLTWHPVFSALRRERWSRGYGTCLTDSGQPAAYIDLSEHICGPAADLITSRGGQAVTCEIAGRVLLNALPRD